MQARSQALWPRPFSRANLSSVYLPDREFHESTLGHAGAGLRQFFCARKDTGPRRLKPDARGDEAHKFGAGIGVERDALLDVVSFGNLLDDIRNAQGGLPDRSG